MAKRGRGKTTHRAKRKPSKRAPAKPLKKKRRAAQKVARTRKRNREEAQIAESLRASERAVAAKRGATTKKTRKRRKEKLAQSEQRAVERGQLSLYETLANALAQLAADSPYPLSVSIEGAPETGKTPWLIAGRFEPEDEPLTYDHWADIFAAWESDYIAEATIGPDRITSLRWEYQRYTEDGDEVGGVQGFAAGGAGAYSRVLAEAQQWCDPSINESQSREATTLVIAVELLLSAELYTGRVIRVGKK